MADVMIRQENSGNGSTSVLKNVVCGSCDGFCPVAAKVEDGRVVKVTTRDHPILKDVICMKGGFAPKSFAHPDRILHPLKRVGARGDNHWQQVMLGRGDGRHRRTPEEGDRPLRPGSVRGRAEQCVRARRQRSLPALHEPHRVAQLDQRRRLLRGPTPPR